MIAASYHRALEAGVKIGHIFETLRMLRAEGTARFHETPLVGMVSFAIVHRLGAERFLDEAAGSRARRSDRPRLARRGISRASAADFCARPEADPAHHADDPARAGCRDCAARPRDLSTMSRSRGSRASARLCPSRSSKRWPGCGSRRICPSASVSGSAAPEQVRQLAPVADGLIVGSAIVRRLSEAINRPRGEVVREIGQFVAELARAL